MIKIIWMFSIIEQGLRPCNLCYFSLNEFLPYLLY